MQSVVENLIIPDSNKSTSNSFQIFNCFLHSHFHFRIFFHWILFKSKASATVLLVRNYGSFEMLSFELSYKTLVMFALFLSAMVKEYPPGNLFLFALLDAGLQITNISFSLLCRSSTLFTELLNQIFSRYLWFHVFSIEYFPPW